MTEDRITLDAGGRAIQRIVVASTLTVAAAAFLAGVPALVWAGSAAQLGLAAWLVPLVVDVGLVVAGLSAAVRHSQHRKARLESGLMLLLTSLSMAVQGIHAWDDGHGTWAAVAIAAVLPLTVLASTHITLRAVLADPAKRRTGRAVAATTGSATASATKTPPTPVKRKAAGPAKAPAPTQDLQPLADLIPLVRAGQISQREAVRRSGENRHRVAAALAA